MSWKLVPLKPTSTMLDAASWHSNYEDMWQAMLEAAPERETMTLKPTKAPCKSCPYRKDAPRGLWARNEYEKLPEYDAPTWAQPPGLFMCHSEPESLCAGWVGCHGGELLALRFAGSTGKVDASTFDYVSPVPLFASGAAAAEHGLSGLDEPDEKARRMLPRLKKKIRKRRRG